jgi:glyoxylase-like metal-dependent hydrolase (beta-lactamase superfamily II)
MTRSVIFAVTAAIVISILSAAHARGDFDDVVIESRHLSGNVYMLKGVGGNIGVSVGPDGILIVDDQFAPLAEKIRKTLSDIGGGKLEYVLNTHWHSDHTGGNDVFGPEATIIAHRNVRRRLAEGTSVMGTAVPPRKKGALPVITFEKSLSIHFNGEEIRAMHLPHGHTDGDAVIFFSASNVVHMGDHLFSGMFPFVDLDNGGTVEGLIHNIEDLIGRIPKNAKIIPGHGPLSTIEDVKRYQDMLNETTAIVRKRMSNGDDLGEVVRAGLPQEWESWSWNFVPTDKWLETIYKSYSN